MPTPTYTPLATVTLGGSAATVTFSSIPATYRDLILVTENTRSTSTNTRARFNSDTGSNYSYVTMTGDSSGAASSAATTNAVIICPTTTGTQLGILQIMDYSATNKHKTALSRASTGTVEVTALANRWANTAAITSIQVLTGAGTFQTGSTFSLYGIAS
jgi:hypothetical protein